MLKIAYAHQLESISGLPAEVMNTIREAVTILDKEYGADRDVDSGYGGFVVVIEAKEEVAKLTELRLDMESIIPEYLDLIHCEDGQVFASSLFLLGSDFAIVLVMPLQMFTHTNLMPT